MPADDVLGWLGSYQGNKAWFVSADDSPELALTK